MITQYIKADILATECKHIAHGVNCQDKMGSGVAKVLYTRYPRVKSSYHEFCFNTPLEIRLGEVQSAIHGDIVIYNCFTQFNYGYDGQKYVSYEAVRECFKALNLHLKGETLAIPKIGAGLAGGDWSEIEAIINEETPDLRVHVYYI